MKYKIIKAEHQSWGVEPCEDKNCPNVHLWFTKRQDADLYAFSHGTMCGKPNLWSYGAYCLAKEICIPERGLVKDITNKLKDKVDVYVTEEFLELIFKGGFKKHLALLQF